MRTLVIVGMTSLCGTCMGQVFVGLGITPGQTFSRAQALSSDGTTVVGGSGPTPWRWTLGGGMQSLGPAPSGLFLSPSSDVSGDGSVVVGSMNDGNLTYAWRWTQGTGIVQVPGVGGGASFGPFVSSDGSTIVGTGVGLSIGPAVRWTQGTGVQSLNPVTGLPFGNGSAILAEGVSADGSVIVGSGVGLYQTSPPASTNVPFRWTQASGTVATLSGGAILNPPNGAIAIDVSADGSTMAVVGGGSGVLWRWTMLGGFELIRSGGNPGGTPRIAGDGLTIVDGNGVWQAGMGRRSLPVVLTDAGCNFAGWNNLLVTDVSFNGNTLCGYGTNPTGQTEAWYATIPAPSGLVIGALAACSAARRRQ